MKKLMGIRTKLFGHLFYLFFSGLIMIGCAKKDLRGLAVRPEERPQEETENPASGGAGVDTIHLHWPAYISLKDYLVPFTAADTIVHELILPIKQTESNASAHLLFPAKKILKVQDVYLEKEYQEHKDWVVNGREITLTAQSSMLFLRSAELLFGADKKMEGFYQEAKEPGYFVLYDEHRLFPLHQLAVTYIPDRGHTVPDQPLKVYDEKIHGKLERTLQKLKQGDPLKIVFYGNSIEVGGNTSGYLGVKPFMPNWTQLVVYQLRSTYSSEISYINNAKGGMVAQWGVENAEQRVANENPDLVVIAFGMNDGTFGVSEADFIGQLQRIMDITKKKNPACEFVLVSPMLANPLAIHSKSQESYRIPMLNLATKGVAVADVTLWHKWLLQNKSYQDMTSNNINHPNDYLARWYAHIVSAILTP
ncbi:SGNH/GDSL hydrolase family protein [Sphingobacterium pedocola]|uniref:SGNH hydrolase-type esterase domain-containing protein n=1 Tax=Sphingobacterium pedocola TaxID=2082722 RepID=A0ABR9T980_9SPHI|nr:SGNH/GDSL hydrolase family protein [Sphingobacterium pedocola]MBE8721855.1 hypothetical protein [Sphingobacterium pedocola]